MLRFASRWVLTAFLMSCSASLATAQSQAVHPGQASNIASFPGMLPGQLPSGFNGVGQYGISPMAQQYMMLRGLQGMGHHHGVQTGYMDPIIGAGPQFDPTAVWSNNGGYGYGANDGVRQTSSDRRAAARAARDEQRHLARERADRNKAKSVKAADKGKFSAK